ncbi:major facilitator superfamily transporter [Seiridium cupressi]
MPSTAMNQDDENSKTNIMPGIVEPTQDVSHTTAAETGTNTPGSGVVTNARDDPMDNSDTQSIARSIGNQRSPLSGKRLMITFPTLCAALFVSFFDQTSVSTSIPAISAELSTGEATSWIGASFLISSTAFQLINGRLSDLFGRKNLLLASLVLLGFGDLLCGFAKTAEQLFAFRAVAGIGGGGVNSIVMIIVSDITTLQNRGKYQGIIGAVLALANGIGPFLGGAVIERATWRWVFWMVPMLAIPAAFIIWFALPLRYDRGNYVEKVKKIDFGGIALSLAAVLLVLVPLSGAGISYAWNSATFIAIFVVGILVWVAFVLVEWKVAKVPIMPFSGAILSNTLSDRLAGLPFITEDMLGSLTSSTYSAGTLGLTQAQQDIVLTVYMDGLRYSFIFYTVCTGLGLITSLGIGNTRLDKEKTSKSADEESQQSAVEDQAPEIVEKKDFEVAGENTASTNGNPISDGPPRAIIARKRTSELRVDRITIQTGARRIINSRISSIACQKPLPRTLSQPPPKDGGHDVRCSFPAMRRAIRSTANEALVLMYTAR